MSRPRCLRCGATSEWIEGKVPNEPAESSFAAPAGSHAPIPDVLFDGNAVWRELDERAKTRTSAENVSDVLDAIVRLMRRSVQENGPDERPANYPKA